MTLQGPFLRGELSDASMTSGAPVRGADWKVVAAAMNYIEGGVNRCLLDMSIGYSGTGTFTVPYTMPVAPRRWARVWRIGIGPGGAKATDNVGQIISISGTMGTIGNVPLGFWGATQNTIVTFVETLGAISTAGTASGTITFTCGSVPVDLLWITCHDLPRFDLDVGDPVFAEIESFGARAPVYYASSVPESIGAIAVALSGGASDVYCRASLLAWAAPASAPVTFTSSAPLWPLGMPVLASARYSGEATRVVTCAVNAKVSAGTGTVKFSEAHGGATVSISVTATSFGWQTATLAIDAENTSAADGLQSSTWDEAQVTGSCSGGTLSVDGAHIYQTTLL